MHYVTKHTINSFGLGVEKQDYLCYHLKFKSIRGNDKKKKISSTYQFRYELVEHSATGKKKIYLNYKKLFDCAIKFDPTSQF